MQTRDAQRRTRGHVASINPSASSTPAEGLRGARLPALQAPCAPAGLVVLSREKREGPAAPALVWLRPRSWYK